MSVTANVPVWLQESLALHIVAFPAFVYSFSESVIVLANAQIQLAS